jgi:hypothetical protein
MNVVISQPMLFPWVGLLEQIRLADTFVFYDDVQFSKGSFTNRVQVKTAQGMAWMTVPLSGLSLGQKIQDVALDTRKDWRSQHLALLRQAYAEAPFRADMLALVDEVYSQPHTTIGALSEASMRSLCDYFGLAQGKRFCHIAELAVPGKGSQRVLDIVQRLGGDHYITGLGAAQYLQHEVFDAAGVSVQYMDYRKLPYPQLHGAFTPYVSALDLVAMEGPAGRERIASGTRRWREHLLQSA